MANFVKHDGNVCHAFVAKSLPYAGNPQKSASRFKIGTSWRFESWWLFFKKGEKFGHSASDVDQQEHFK